MFPCDIQTIQIGTALNTGKLSMSRVAGLTFGNVFGSVGHSCRASNHFCANRHVIYVYIFNMETNALPFKRSNQKFSKSALLKRLSCLCHPPWLHLHSASNWHLRILFFSFFSFFLGPFSPSLRPRRETFSISQHSEGHKDRPCVRWVHPPGLASWNQESRAGPVRGSRRS